MPAALQQVPEPVWGLAQGQAQESVPGQAQESVPGPGQDSAQEPDSGLETAQPQAPDSEQAMVQG